ncbi:vicilin-like seed storage protein At2g18540 [Nematostella vectensis]|uniref:vicilin-like seed storage protein At2g18540 n=1 Tax=Nematostella vectensis TaxID=45351 RepID=UPI0020772CFC|nr:vicilin-like seed storage protein At2g18540 [Nematostella vectensis]
MSNTYVSRHSAARRSRKGDLTHPGDGDDDDPTSSQQTPQQQPLPRVERREAYTMIRPDEKKREKILQVARTEEENAHKRKLNKQTTPIKITPSPLGGGQSSEQDAKLRLQRENERKTRQKALEVKKKREEYRKKEKEREDEEITKKKALAREQAEKNARKDSLKKEEMRRHNVEYFESKFSGMNTQTQEDCSTSVGTLTGGLEQLSRRYPSYAPDYLSGMLRSCGGSVENVIDLLDSIQ